MTLGFLGSGAITSAIVEGLNGGGEDRVLLSPRNAEVSAGLAHRFRNVSVAGSNQEMVDSAETVVIAVRPQIAVEVLRELRFRAGQVVISLVSGLPVSRLAEVAHPATRISRAVPLPSAARKLSPTAIYPNDEKAAELFSRVGTAFAADTEDAFDVLCSVTATMATYFAFADGVASWLVRNGTPHEQARDYVARLLFGLADTTANRPERTFGELAADHATRGGTNEQVLKGLTEHGVFVKLDQELDGILRRVTGNKKP